MKYITKVGKSGNSLSCRISKLLADGLGLHLGMKVSVESVENGFNVRIINPPHPPALPFSECSLVNGFTPQNAYADLLE